MKILYTIILSVILALQVSAQNGLERVIVEKYYVSDANDTSVNADGGELPVNSVTYRVFVDMLPGYIFQAAFGTPEHELKIATTTKFFNNEDRGSGFPSYTRSQAQNNTVMLDSWLSVGASLKDYAGVLKENDNGVNTIVNADGVLQNQHVEAGIPLTVEDGAILSATQPVTVVGFSDTDLTLFESSNDGPIPSIISTHDGAWSSLLGSMGPDSLENVVLIGQFTTDGVFEFELNLQIRNQQTLGVETYVARNPIGTEIQFDDLIHIDSLGLISAIDDVINLNNEIIVFPNPSSGELFVEISDEISIIGNQNFLILKNPNGTTVYNERIVDSKSTIDLENLTPGVYILNLKLDNRNSVSRKVVYIP